MQFNLFGYEFKFSKETRKLQDIGAEAKKKQSWKKIKEGLDHIDQHQLDYSEYRLKKITGVALPTIRKYRDKIAKYRGEANSNLFS